MTEDTAPAALFEVEELERPLGNGRVEAGTHRAIVEAEKLGKLLPEHAGLVAAALAAARTLDRAERLPDKSAVYAVPQIMRPYQDAMHALGLPQEVAAVPAAGARLPAESQGQGASWLSDELGPS